MNAAEIQLALQKLEVCGSVLYIAAHPDDENTALLTYLSKEKLLRTGYLSLTRGDGGQNLIGTESDEYLGVIRTQELLAARSIDGAEQFFTRAIDFGYSKSPEESLNLWDREEILRDMVWVIRRFRPDILITRFTPEVGGHGHHRASAILALEAFQAAGDPDRFPEQLRDVDTWQPRRIFWNAWRPALEQRGTEFNRMPFVDLGTFNRLLGKSYGEMSAISRSMHKSQGFGAAPRRGTYPEYFQILAGDSVSSDLLEGIDLSWGRVKGSEKIRTLIRQARQEYRSANPREILPLLLSLHREMTKLPSGYWPQVKMKELREIIRSCAGIWLEAAAGSYYLNPGNPVTLTISALQRSDYPFTLKKVRLIPSNRDSLLYKNLEFNQLFNFTTTIDLPDEAQISQPFWLVGQAGNGMFSVPDRRERGAAENGPAIQVIFTLLADSLELNFPVPVIYKWTDPVDGEKYRPAVIVPAVSARFLEKLYIFPDDRPKKIELRARNLAPRSSGTFSLSAPENWKIEPAEADFSFSDPGLEKNFPFQVYPPQQESIRDVQLSYSNSESVASYDLITISYPHIPIQTVFSPTHTRLLRLKLTGRPLNVGYIMGSGDDIPAVLAQIGYRVNMLNEENVLSQNLGGYDVIITGIRAYNTNSWLKSIHPRLLDYVAGGGTLLVQYNVSRDLILDELGPYPFRISRDRVSDETAPVQFLLENHPVFNYPFPLTPADFQGWVQERGLYFANQWDPRYQTLLESHDPGEEAQAGGILYTRYGKGTYIYTGYAFFRQLPAGVPGAMKLFINLLNAGQKRDK